MIDTGKIIVISVSDEEKIFENIQKYLLSNTGSELIELDSIANLYFDGLEIDLYHRRVLVKGKNIELSDLEFRLLLYLARQPERVFTYEQIYEAVWGEEYAYEKGHIMSHVCHIRGKLKLGSEIPQYIENIRGVGYRFKQQ